MQSRTATREIAAAELGRRGTPPHEVPSILRDARSYRALCEGLCNYPQTERQDKRRERLCVRLEAIGAHTHQDPRGSTAFLSRNGNPDDIGGRIPLDF